MPHSIQLKDGKLLTPFSVRDVLEEVEEYAGWEIRRYIEEFVAEAEDTCKGYEEDYKEIEKEMEAAADHQRRILCDIKEELEAVRDMLCAERLNRKRIQDAVSHIHRMVYAEL